MFIMVFLIANSYYFVVANHTAFVYRHLFFSGLSKIAYYLATYIVLFALSKLPVRSDITSPYLDIKRIVRRILGNTFDSTSSVGLHHVKNDLLYKSM